MNDIGILIAGHGERGGNADNGVLLALRDRVATLVAAPVEAGVLSGEPSIDHALQALARGGCERILVYPFFMSDGYFVRTVVPERLARCGVSLPWRVLPPLGLDIMLPALIRRRALAETVSAGWRPAKTRLLIVGHGSSKSRASAEATRVAADNVAMIKQFKNVETAFLEEPPYIADRVGREHGPTVIAGFFSAEGLHARDDIPAAIAWTGARYTGPIGAEPEIAEFVASAIRRAIAGT